MIIVSLSTRIRKTEVEVHFVISSLTGDDVLVSGDNCRIIIDAKKIHHEKLAPM